MLVSVYFPFSDERCFLPTRSKLVGSRFLRLGDRRPFLRNLGEIIPRPDGGFKGWIGENAICNIRDAVSIGPCPPPPGCSDPIEVAFKRMFFDGAQSGYFSVGFSIPDGDGDRIIANGTLIEFVEQLASIRAHSRHRKNKDFLLYTLSKLLVDLYAAGSVKKLKSLEDTGYRQGVVAGLPIIIISLGASATDNTLIHRAVGGPSFHYIVDQRWAYSRYVQWDDRIMTVILCSNTEKSAADSRFLRAGIARLYLEVFSLERMINLAESGKVSQFDEEGLNLVSAAVNRGLRRLQGADRPELAKDGLSFDLLIEMFSNVFRPGYVAQIEQSIERLKARPNLANALRDSFLARETTAGPIIQIYGEVTMNTTIQTGGISVSGGHVEVSGDMVGGDKTVTITAGQINEAIKPIADAINDAPPEKRDKAAKTLEALKQEAQKGKGADDKVLAGLVDGLVGLVPTAVSAVVSAFASPILGGIAGPITKWVIEKIVPK